MIRIYLAVAQRHPFYSVRHSVRSGCLRGVGLACFTVTQFVLPILWITWYSATIDPQIVYGTPIPGGMWWLIGTGCIIVGNLLLWVFILSDKKTAVAHVGYELVSKPVDDL